MSLAEHSVVLRVGRKAVDGWQSYSIDLDMLQPADAFSLTFAPVRRDVWELCAPDEEVQVLVDDVIVLTGRIDDRLPTFGKDGSAMTVNGRDKGGRLVDESAPLVAFGGLTISDLALRCVTPWFEQVTVSNERNRRLVRGHGRLAGASREPAILKDARARKKVDPGESRWQVLEFFLREAELLGWSSADGKELVIGLPNYDQEPQYRFFIPAQGSRRQAEGNALAAELKDSVGERYAKITACGSGRGNKADYSERVVKNRGIARNNPKTSDGTGLDFKAPKSLLIAHDDVRSLERAQTRADREMAVRNASRRTLSLTAQGHGQIYAGRMVLFAFDTIAEVEIEELGIRDHFLVSHVTMSLSGKSGRTTQLELVPKGTRLVA